MSLLSSSSSPHRPRACLTLHWSVPSVPSMSEAWGQITLHLVSMSFPPLFQCQISPNDAFVLQSPLPNFFHDLPPSWPWTFYLLPPPLLLLSSPVWPWRADPCAVLPRPPHSLGSAFGGSCHWCPGCYLTALASLIFPFALSFPTMWTSLLCPGLSSLIFGLQNHCRW